MKKFIIFVSAICLLFSSCKYNENTPDVTTSFSAETTSLTLTEMLENDDLIVENSKINIGIFDPFSDKRKANKTEEKELREAVHKISDAFSFYNSSNRFCSGSDYFENAADTDTVLEYNRSSGDFYSPLNTDYADSEEKLVQKMLEAFTENYSSENGINEALFISENYKIIDGKLCMKIRKRDNLYPIDFNNIKICSCEGDSAEIIADEEGSPENEKKYYLQLRRSDEYGWRLDNFQECYPYEADLFYTALYLKKDTLNKILNGGNYTDDPEIIFDDDKIYIETDLDMSIEEMHDFFSETFDEYPCEMYSENYIDDIFIEKDGKIFRNHDAKRYYMLEPKMDIFEQNASHSFYYSDGSTNNYTIIINEKDGSPIISSGIPIEEKKAEIPIEKFIPFKDADVSENVKSELKEAVIKIADSRAMLYANITGFRKQDDTYFGDLNNVFERNDKEEYTYAPIDQEYASNFDELTNQMRAVFTENFISDEELQKTLFESDRNVPEYKMIDGKLCALHQYMGVMTTLIRDDFKVISYDGKTADIICYAEGLDMPYDFSIVKLVNSDEYGWRLDYLEFKENYPKERNIVYNALLLKTEKLNKIFSGGNIPENAETIEINGEIYTETDLDLSIKDMEEFFVETFSPTKFRKENADVISDYVPSDILRENYIKKYISDVYYEKDGVIFRKNSAARYYVLEAVFDPFIKAYTYGYCSSPYDGNGAYYEFNMPFLKTDGNVISENIAFSISIATTDEKTGNNYYTYLNIASEIPLAEIKENS